MSTPYSKIRFIGYAIPTTPANLECISLPSEDLIIGTYAANQDTNTDINGRIQIMKNAVDTAKANLPANEDGVINLFVAPEFYFHGFQGPYVFQADADDPINPLMQGLKTVFNAADYPNWTFVFGSIVTTQIQSENHLLASNSAVIRNSIVEGLYLQYAKSFGPLQGIIADMIADFIQSCHSYPCCVVRNRSVVISNLGISPIPVNSAQANVAPVNIMSVEKYFVSSMDFLIYDKVGTNSITEQMTAYSPIDISDGDLKQSQFDPYAIFSQDQIDPANPRNTSTMNYGVEVCLDHYDMRLRQNIDNEPSTHGGIHVQVIPSCGMQIIPASIAADVNGFVFNCDGQGTIGADACGQATIDDVSCLYAKYTDSGNNIYQAHTQLARVQIPANGINPIKTFNATCQKLNEGDISVFSVTPPADFDSYFAGGGGEIHIYGLNNPYTIYP